MRDFLRLWLLLSVVWIVGCSGGDNGSGTTTTTTSSSTTSGTGGGSSSPCAVDCSTLQTGKCEVAVCNTGQVDGPLNVCIVLPAPDGSSCDDGLFCTADDTCNKGKCVGGPPNDCGMAAPLCSSAVCDEASKSCTVAPVKDGTECAPLDLCQINGACTAGACVGVPRDCTLSPLTECNAVACDSSTGKCTGTPDPTKDGTLCELTGDLCSNAKACSSGQCVGGTPRDCSGLDFECQVGMCDGGTGLCQTVNAPVGAACSQGVQVCQVGGCDTNGACVPTTSPNGTPCNDHDACTGADSCNAGACTGAAVAGCKPYLREGFEICPDGWTLMGDWQCGTPTAMSPVTPHTGQGVLATQLAGLYHKNQSFSSCVADSPPIDLTLATNPHLSFWAWVHTEGGTFDGWNLKVSTDGGQTFEEVLAVTPFYPLTILTQPSWGGDLSSEGWQLYMADLTAYAGHSVILRHAFRSDPVTVFPGVYIDDLLVAEPAQIPLYITTPSPLPDVYAENDYSVKIEKVGGALDSQWSIDPVGVNKDWLHIDSSSGVLTGRPDGTQTGPVTVTIRVHEPTLPSNFAVQTFTFKVKPDVYFANWEDTCPAGWALTGEWKCGVPMNVGPMTTYDGTQCIGTGMTANYSNDDTFAGNTATSPEIDLAGVSSPLLTFRMWVDTEGFTYDGAHLAVSDDDGMTYAAISPVMPYPLVIGGEPAWGGNQATLGWQLVQVDLAAYSGKKVRFQLAFQSDFSNTFSGFYVDHFLVQ